MHRLQTLLALILSSGCALPSGGGGGADRIERYIRGDAASRLVIELDFVAGAEPRAGAEAMLTERLGRLLDKPGGVEIVRGDEIPSRGADHRWSFDELSSLAAANFDDDQPADTASMHVMWLDGRDDDDSDSGATLGLAFGNRHIVMYHDTIEGSCRGGPLIGAEVCTQAQYLVWLHEVGHTIGLVDNGLPMVEDHRDADHGRHDDSDQCAMYFAFESRSGLDLLRDRLSGSALPDFDSRCLADVAALRDR